MKKQQLIPNAAMERIIKNAGAIRVSEEAKKELNSILEKKGEKIAKKAILYAEHAGRETIQAKDVLLALKD